MAFVKRFGLIILIPPTIYFSCQEDKKETKSQAVPKSASSYTTPPIFNEDSAFIFLKNQIAFGPRIPNTPAHKKCGDYLMYTCKRFCDSVITQPLEIKAYDGMILKGRNIIGEFNPRHKRRILLAAHWDTRPIADEDPKKKTSFDGADDGASGVSILLEIMRILKTNKPALGIDFIFFDLEDYGKRDASEHTFCLGSQYWSKNPHKPNYQAEYGILLDMVGARGARFYREGYSTQFASHILDKVWMAAGRQGFGHIFINEGVNPVTDDHYYINKIAGIPTIDIINFNERQGGFPPHWHTQNDNLDIIDKNTLKAVGQTLLDIIFNP